MSDTSRVYPVTVDVWTDAAGAVQFSCNPDPLDVGKGHCEVLIVFTLNGTGFSFAQTDAIVLADKSKADFPYPSWTINATTAALFDRNKKVDRVKYIVNVVDAEGAPHSYDPEIRNGGDGTTCCDD